MQDFRDAFDNVHYDAILARVGEDVEYSTDAGATWRTVRGAFERPAYQYTEGDTAVQSRQPTFECKERDVPNAAQDHLIRFEGITYRVKQVAPEGTEIVELGLERCAVAFA